MNKTTKISMKVKENSFRRFEDPLENASARKYNFYVKVGDVPMGIPMATNPRDQNTKTDVAKAIHQSLLSNDGYFHLKNRGIVLSADSVHFDNRSNKVTLHFRNDELHGNVDGGHTYKIICDNLDENLKQYVSFEVMTGVEDIIEQLAEARNTSVQVDVKSLAELQKQFEPIKEALEGMVFYQRIAFKQNQSLLDDETGRNLKMIDAREIVAILGMFNIERFPRAVHPTQAYSSKAKMLEFYLDSPEAYRRFINIAPDIFDLYDAVEQEFATTYNESGNRYGRKHYSGYKGQNKEVGKSKFSLTGLTYRIPDGFIYPVVAAFRSLVELNSSTQKYQWINGHDPYMVWSKSKNELVNKIMNFASSIGDNPNTVGKDSNIWDLAYMTVQQYA